MASPTVTLNDGRQIPWLGFGTGTALYQKDAQASVELALKCGVVHLDGAQLYENEDSLGAAIAAAGVPRAALFVTTKLGKLPDGQTVRDTLLESLRKLRLDYVDLFLIHMPIQHAGRLPQVWREFEALQKEGLAKSIGVSNFRVKDFEQLMQGATVTPAVNQVCQPSVRQRSALTRRAQIEYHPYVYKWSEDVMEYHKKHGIVTTSYGGLTPIVRHKGGPVDPILAKIRERLEKESGKTVTEGQVLGLWLKALDVVQITYVMRSSTVDTSDTHILWFRTSSKEERIKEYLVTASLPDLTPAEVKEISEAGSPVHHRAFVSSSCSVSTRPFDERLLSVPLAGQIDV